MSGVSLELPPIKLIAVPFAGHLEALNREMPRVWSELIARQPEIAGVVEPAVRYDVSRWFDNVSLECVGVQVEAFERIPAGMVGFELPGGRYLRFVHRGPMSEVQATYHRAYSFLAQAGELLDPLRPRFERYDTRYLPSHDDRQRAENAYDIFLPVV